MIKLDEVFNNKKSQINYEKFKKEHSQVQNLNIKKYDPIDELTESIKISELPYEKLEPYKYFINYNNFILPLSKSNQENTKKSIDFIRCLCKLYVGQFLHCKIQSIYTLFIYYFKMRYQTRPI